jgi:hypothetical protein
MLRPAAIVFVAALALAPPLTFAHPGHGEIVLYSGQVLTVESERVELEVFDKASFTNRRVWVVVDGKTVVRAGKERLPISALRAGQKIEFAGETDEGPDGKSLVRAVTFRVKVK